MFGATEHPSESVFELSFFFIKLYMCCQDHVCTFEQLLDTASWVQWLHFSLLRCDCEGIYNNQYMYSASVHHRSVISSVYQTYRGRRGTIADFDNNGPPVLMVLRCLLSFTEVHSCPILDTVFPPFQFPSFYPSSSVVHCNIV